MVLILSATATVVVRCQEANLDELLGDEGSGSGDYEVFQVRYYSVFKSFEDIAA